MLVAAGDLVRMSADFKAGQRLLERSWPIRLIDAHIARGRWRRTRFGRRRRRPQWPTHVEEFGECVGVVELPCEFGPPFVEVRWRPSGLRYAYDAADLEVANAG